MFQNIKSFFIHPLLYNSGRKVDPMLYEVTDSNFTSKIIARSNVEAVILEYELRNLDVVLNLNQFFINYTYKHYKIEKILDVINLHKHFVKDEPRYTNYIESSFDKFKALNIYG